MDRLINALLIFMGIILLLALVVGAWMLAIFSPGVRDIIDALR